MNVFTFLSRKPSQRKPQPVFIDTVGLFSPNEVGCHVFCVVDPDRFSPTVLKYLCVFFPHQSSFKRICDLYSGISCSLLSEMNVDVLQFLLVFIVNFKAAAVQLYSRLQMFIKGFLFGVLY